MDLGELRLLSTMPGVLIENGYHDNPQDVEALKDPRFNLLSVRAVYQGLVRYWHEQDPNVSLVFLPEPPTRLSLRNSGPGQTTLTWRPGPTGGSGSLGDAATSYRVYTSADGFGWGDAIATPATTLTLTGLAPNQLIYVRVTGVNAGGESFPTPVLAARVATNDVAPALIVYGFDRIDRKMLIQQNDTPEGLNRRMFLDRINRYDYIAQHAQGIAYAFDSAVHAAVTSGDVGLGNYTIVDWIGGREQAPDVALNATDQALLRSFLDDGGALLISGSEIGFDLVSNGIGPAFYNNTLHASFVSDNAGTYNVLAVNGSIFEGLGSLAIDDGTHGTYNVDSPDVFAPQPGASSALLYNGDPNSTAALTYASGPCTRLVYMGFPLETIYPQATRMALMAKAMTFLGACAAPPGPDTSITSPSDGAAYNTVPPFNGTAGGPSGVTAVQVAILSGTTYYSGTTFVPAVNWLTATGGLTWSYALPALPDGVYQLQARAFVSSTLFDTTPAVVTFTLDSMPPDTPVLITPTGGISIPALMPTFIWTGGGNPSGFFFQLDGVTDTLNGPALSVTHSVTEGLHTWRVRAFDRAGNLSGWSTPATFVSFVLKSYLPIIANGFTVGIPIGPACHEAIVNGGFASGMTGWTLLASNPPPAIVTSPVFTGFTQSMQLGSDITTISLYTGFSSVQQAVTIPVTATSVTLAFQRYRISGDTVNDLQYVAVVSGTSVLDYLIYEHVNDPQWVAAQFDLTPYAGQPINVRFSVKNDGTGGATGMYVDGVSLQICR
jgi:hypothetical protein